MADICEILELILEKDVNDSIKLFLEDYKKILRRDIVTDQELKIYVQNL